MALHRAAHAVAEQPLEESRLACPDHDEVGAALLGELDDRFARVP